MALTDPVTQVDPQTGELASGYTDLNNRAEI